MQVASCAAALVEDLFERWASCSGCDAVRDARHVAAKLRGCCSTTIEVAAALVLTSPQPDTKAAKVAAVALLDSLGTPGAAVTLCMAIASAPLVQDFLFAAARAVVRPERSAFAASAVVVTCTNPAVGRAVVHAAWRSGRTDIPDAAVAALLSAGRVADAAGVLHACSAGVAAANLALPAVAAAPQLNLRRLLRSRQASVALAAAAQADPAAWAPRLSALKPAHVGVTGAEAAKAWAAALPALRAAGASVSFARSCARAAFSWDPDAVLRLCGSAMVDDDDGGRRAKHPPRPLSPAAFAAVAPLVTRLPRETAWLQRAIGLAGTSPDAAPRLAALTVLASQARQPGPLQAAWLQLVSRVLSAFKAVTWKPFGNNVGCPS